MEKPSVEATAIRALPTAKRAICTDAVEALEEALELAKDGKVDDLTLVLHINDGGDCSVMYRGTATHNVARALGDLAILQHNLLSNW